MNALNLQFDGDDHVVMSPTAALLDARGAFARLRALLSYPRFAQPNQFCIDVNEELDRLVDLYADTLQAFDGMVAEETHVATVKDLEQAQADAEEADTERDQADEKVTELEAKLKELTEAAVESPEKLESRLVIAFEAVEKRDAEIVRLREINQRLQNKYDQLRMAEVNRTHPQGPGVR